MTIKEILQKATKILSNKKISSAALDAEVLLLHALAQSKNKLKSFNDDRSWLYAHNDYELAKPQENKFLIFIKRREKMEPVAYLTGKKEFFGLEFYVNKNVLIPRPETEILVESVLKDIAWRFGLHLEAEPPSANRKIIIADIGTGSGAIAVAIAKNLKNAGQIGKVKIYATDISAKALKIAKKNAKIHNCDKNIIFKKGNLLKALPKNSKVNFSLVNLPYVGNDYYYKWLRNGSRPSEFREIKYEPKISLLAKNNGLEYFYKLFPFLPKYMAKNSKIFLESDPYQIPAIKKLAKKYLPKHKISVIKDLRRLNRITKIEIKP